MGLFGGLFIFSTPIMMVELICYDGLSAFVDMDVAHGLLARLVQFGQGFDRCPALGLRFHSDAERTWEDIRNEVESTPIGHLLAEGQNFGDEVDSQQSLRDVRARWLKEAKSKTGSSP